MSFGEELLKSTLYRNLIWKKLLLIKFSIFFFFAVPTQMEALIGETVYLPCNISTQEINDDIILILWYREDKGTPIYR
jgi:hypothetical protein